jgi:hypothetical protein
MKMREYEYNVVSSVAEKNCDTSEISRLVTEKLNNGFELVGDIHVTALLGSLEGKVCYSQALMKEKKTN